MAIDYIKVNTDRMKSDEADLISRLTQAKKRMQEICDSMQTLLGYWEGAASETQTKVYEAERENMEQLQTLLDELIAELGSAASTYNTCEQQVADLVNALQV